jgi:hypothetical protein
MILYGRNAVREALRGRRRVYTIWATERAAQDVAPGRAVRSASPGEIESRCGSDGHQGVCAEVDPFSYADPDALLSADAPFLVALDEITDPQNLGAICRTAECAGATGSSSRAPLGRGDAGGLQGVGRRGGAPAVARVRNLADFSSPPGAGAGPRRGGGAAVAYAARTTPGGCLVSGGGPRAPAGVRRMRRGSSPAAWADRSLNVSATAAVLLYEMLQHDLTRPHNVSDRATQVELEGENRPESTIRRQGRSASRTFAACALGKDLRGPISHKSQAALQLDDSYLLALAEAGKPDAYEQLVRRYYSFVRLKASSYFLIGGDSDDLIQEGSSALQGDPRLPTDRESSFRNFAELCITRQIITAVKTATRNKHTPLNGYVSFSSSPAGAAEGEATSTRSSPARPPTTRSTR